MLAHARIVAVIVSAVVFTGGCTDATGLRRANTDTRRNDPAWELSAMGSVGGSQQLEYHSAVVDLDGGYSVEVTGPVVNWHAVPVIGAWVPSGNYGGPNCDQLRLQFYQGKDEFDEGWDKFWKGLLAGDIFGDMAEGKLKMQAGFRKMMDAKTKLEQNSCINPPARTT